MNAQYFEQQIKALADKAARERDRDGDFQGTWQLLVDALTEAHEAAERIAE